MDLIEDLVFQTSKSESKSLACKSESKSESSESKSKSESESAKTGLESGLESKSGLEYYKSGHFHSKHFVSHSLGVVFMLAP